MISAANPIQARRIGRALAWMPYVRETPPISFNDPTQTWPTWFNLLAREYRCVVRYPVTANAGEKYLLTTNGQQVFWDAAPLVSYLADQRQHHVYVSYVSEETSLGLQPMRLSRACRPHAFQEWHNMQVDAGISRDHPLYIHPLDRLHTDAVIAELLVGQTIDFAGQQNTIVDFMHHEEQLMDEQYYLGHTG